ncbi:hypothetical protein [Saccharibacillus endophyticus]|uniref:Lantibiotic dehydratase N-terminal domain-containing protein n=1 Tax=Saccharibacillus endophyticus TaxID=2060666 RepID=A0ABQ1ZV50_9BACL|nr:hypothetical protein [Saccharibacillus endophyticus]GGH78004.1 hypothetical protein GCM10007362_22610 [Saccharibacillus endophyticus]
MSYVNPFVLVRTNSLDKQAIEVAGRNELENFNRQTVDLRQHFRQAKAEAVATLETLMQSEGSSLLLNLKRAVYNERFSRFEKLVREAGPELAPASETIEKLRKSWNALAEADRIFTDDYERLLNDSRQRMHAVVGSSGELQNNLLMIQPNMYAKLRKYLDTPSREHKNSERKLDYTLYKVLARAAFKTSPFAEITRVGRAERVSEAQAAKGPGQLHFRRWSKINYTFLNRLVFEYLLGEDSFYGNVLYKIPPLSIEYAQGQVSISFVATRDDRKSEKIFETSEILKKLRMNEELAGFFKAHSVNHMVSLSDFEELFRERGVTKEELCRLLREYVQIGLLIPAIGFSQQTEAGFIKEINEAGRLYLSAEKSGELEEVLNLLIHTKNRLGECEDMEERSRLYQEVGLRLNEYPEAKRVRMDPSRLFYEDGVIAEPLPIAADRIEEDLPVFEALQKISLLFDVNVRMQLELGARLDRENITELDSRFFTALFDVSKPILPYWSGPFYCHAETESKWVKQLDELKLQFIHELNVLCEGCEEVDILPLVERYARRIPEPVYVMADLSSSFFIQMNGRRKIVNAIYDGQEKYKSRFMDYFQDYLRSSEAYKQFEEDYYYGQGYREYTENFGFNGNIKESTLTQCVKTVGTGRKRFSKIAEDYLKVETLTIGCDPVTKAVRFFEKDTGLPLKILFRGSLIPTAMPGYISTLLQLFASGRMTFKFADLVQHSSVPRMSAGRVVVCRKRTALAAMVPILGKREEESPAEHYKRLNLHYTECNSAKRFFITAKRDLSDKTFRLIDFKPFYVDLLDPVSVKVMEKEIICKYAASAYENLYLEEFLGDDSPHATEYDIEFYKKEGQS